MFSIIRKNLSTGFPAITVSPEAGDDFELLGSALSEKLKQLGGGRSLHVREVDAGSCNGCEIEITGLSTPHYDIERFGVHFVASPRHADILLVTGPVTRQMETALLKTYEAAPEPRIVIACGGCAMDCGVYAGSYAVSGRVEDFLPVHIKINGCPPKPELLLKAFLAAAHLIG